MRASDPAGAKAHFLKALAMANPSALDDPRAGMSLRYLGDAAFAAKDYDGARRFYNQELALLERISAQFPDIVYDEFQLGRIELAHAYYGAALRRFERAWQVRKNNSAVHIPGSNSVLIHMAIAQTFAGRTADASQTLLRIGSTSRHDRRRLADDLAEGRETTGQARRALPPSVSAKTKQDVIALELSLAEKAVEAWKAREGKVSHGYAQALKGLAVTLQETGRTTEAADTRQRALAMLQQMPPTQLNADLWADILLDVPQPDQTAEAGYLQCLKFCDTIPNRNDSFPIRWKLLTELGALYQRRGRTEQSIASMERAVFYGLADDTPASKRTALKNLNSIIHLRTALHQMNAAQKSVGQREKLIKSMSPLSAPP